MKNKKLATGATGSLLALLMLAGCASEQKQNRKVTRAFAEWMLNRAKTEALAESANDTGLDYTGEVWFMKAKQDSAKYRAALERDADIVLDYAGKYHSAHKVWEQIQKAELSYAYGPGSFINENGEWEYGDRVNNGASKEYKLKINYNEYKNSLKQIYRIRNARAMGK